jgi:TIR domain/SIR2-like domain
MSIANYSLKNVHRYPEISKNDRFWNHLLDSIECGQVLPIVGQGVTTYGEDNKPLAPLLADMLADELEIDREGLPASFTVHDVVCRHITRGHIDAVYKALPRILSNAKLKPGITLQQLASIDKFDLYISTTFDSLLSQAIDQIRYDCSPKTQLWEFSPNCDETSIRCQHNSDSTVFQILGRCEKGKKFVVWEDDMLEFILSFHKRFENKQSDYLSTKLRDPSMHYLMLGLNLSDWLVRFLLRIVRQSKMSKESTIELIDSEDSPSFTDGLVMFFNSVTHANIVNCDPKIFVAELSRRWEERHGAVSLRFPKSTSSLPNATGQEGKSVFISYCREDSRAAERLHLSLKSYGINSWFDRERLGAAMNYDRELERQVKICDMFIAVVSKTTESTKDSYFWNERTWAAMRGHGRSEFDRGEFYVPVVIDDLDLGQIKREPEIFRSSHVTRLPNGNVTPEFIQRILEILNAK